MNLCLVRDQIELKRIWLILSGAANHHVFRDGCKIRGVFRVGPGVVCGSRQRGSDPVLEDSRVSYFPSFFFFFLFRQSLALRSEKLICISMRDKSNLISKFYLTNIFIG